MKAELVLFVPFHMSALQKNHTCGALASPDLLRTASRDG